MKFYDRETELQTLDAMQRLSRSKGARMTVLYGRRRIGKTVLALHSAQQSDVPHVYLFVSRKNEALLCQDAKTEIERGLGTTVHGDFTRFRDVLAWLMDYASRTPLTLIIDEFQEFTTINPAIFSELQEIWDRSKSGSRLHLIISGSVYRLMKSIFEDAREPLFGRADERIHLQPFRTGTLTEIMRSHHPGFTPQDLLCLYAVTGGIPKYVEMLADKGAMTCTAMRDELFRPDSWWLDEGANLLIGEFGREHTTYFSILSLVASGKTARTEIESVLEKNIGGYLDRLIHDFQILTAVRPLLSKPAGKIQKYEISDLFLRFWFRFVHKHHSAVESGNMEWIKSVFDRDFSTYAGRVLELWFRDALRSTGRDTRIGSYWDRGGNEIDLVAMDEAGNELLFAEVKMNPDKASRSLLEQKAAHMMKKTGMTSGRAWNTSYRVLSPGDMLATTLN